MISTSTNNSFLDAILVGIQKNNQDAEQLVRGLSEPQLNWTPAPRVWSIAQCFDHLAVTSEQLRRYMANAIARARREASTAVRPYQPTWFGRLFINALNPDSTRRFKAPKIFRPADQPAPGAVHRFLVEQHEVVSLVQNVRGVDLNIKVRSPVSPLIRYSLGDAFQIIVAHAQRHLRQARRIGERREFPRAPA